MNYRHAYHAGNFADVFKHIALMLMLEYLHRKDKPVFLLDTHAGTGIYNLQSEEALKTLEAGQGIGLLWNDPEGAPPAVARYLDLIGRWNRPRVLDTYPGSPLIMRETLRASDRLVVNELHPQDAYALRKAMGDDDQVQIEMMDGYQALKALVPPPERRGLVLVDPPFEVLDEFAQITKALVQAHKRWATGIYMFWYPIKNETAIAEFHDAVAALAIPDVAAFEFRLDGTNNEPVFNGSGLLIVNAPWTLKEEMADAALFLVSCLTDGRGRYDYKVITPAA